MEHYGAAKYYISIIVNLQKFVGDEQSEIPFRTPASELLESTEIEDEVYRHIEILNQRIDQFTQNGKL